MFATLFTIWLLHVAALLSPGANVLLISQMAASDRAKSACYAAVGVSVGTAAWSASAVLGVNTLFLAFPALRLGLQIAGGLYLLWVASRLWRSSIGPLTGPAASVAPLTAFRLGFLTNITNPKSALFFGSVFAASFPAIPGTALQIAAVGMVVTNALCWHLLLALVFSRSQVQVAYARARNKANKIASFAVGALGLALLFATLKEIRK